MHASKSEQQPTPTNTVKVIVFLWFVLVFMALMYYTTGRLVDFDPNAQLLDSSNEPSFYTDLQTALQDRFGSLDGKVFHFTQDGCFCNIVAEAHITDIKSMVTDAGETNVLVSLAEHPKLQRFVPSTPAIAIYNNTAELIYIGPYSTGYLCTTGNGLVEELIPRMSQTDVRPVVMSLARGCYCNVQTSAAQ